MLDKIVGQAKGFVDSGIKNLLGGGGGGGPKDGFNAQNIISSLAKSGVAHSGYFEVFIISNIQRPTTFDKSGDESQMRFRAEAAEIPGRSLATVDQRFDNYSPVSRVVTGQTYTDVTVSFLLSEDMREKEYFERWQDSAVQTGAFQDVGVQVKNNPQYYNNYVGTVEIRQYGSAGDLRSVHKLDNAFPIVLGGVQMNWSDESFARLQVSFSYQRYRAVFYNQDQPEKGISGGFSIGPGGISGSLNVPGIGTFGAGGGRTAVNLGGLKKKIFNAL
jgi:hypothetical protein